MAHYNTWVGLNMANINDVAKLAGVSRTLVSRVLNQQSGVSAESKKKIMEAIAALDYAPSAIARSMVTQKTHIVGVVLDNLCDTYTFDMIHAIEEVMENSDYQVVFCGARDDIKSKLKYIRFFAQGTVDGFIVYGSNMVDSILLEAINRSHFPVVVVEHNLEEHNVNNVVVDNRYGSRCAVNHLYQQGCRSICHITGNLAIQAAMERRDGFLEAMQELNLPRKEDDIIDCDFSVSKGYQVTVGYLQRHGRGDLPDAFYCGGDNPAYGCLTALRDSNIRVPEDVMVVGYDNAEVKLKDIHRLPKLTTIAQPMHDMGINAAQILLDDLSSTRTIKQRVVLYPTLVVGETTREIRR